MKWKLPHYWVLTGLLCTDWPPVRRMSSVFKQSTSWVSAMNPRNRPLFLWEPLLVSLPFTIQSPLIFHQETIYFDPFPLAKHSEAVFQQEVFVIDKPMVKFAKKKKKEKKKKRLIRFHLNENCLHYYIYIYTIYTIYIMCDMCSYCEIIPHTHSSYMEEVFKIFIFPPQTSYHLLNWFNNLYQMSQNVFFFRISVGHLVNK